MAVSGDSLDKARPAFFDATDLSFNTLVPAIQADFESIKAQFGEYSFLNLSSIHVDISAIDAPMLAKITTLIQVMRSQNTYRMLRFSVSKFTNGNKHEVILNWELTATHIAFLTDILNLPLFYQFILSVELNNVKNLNRFYNLIKNIKRGNGYSTEIYLLNCNLNHCTEEQLQQLIHTVGANSKISNLSLARNTLWAMPDTMFLNLHGMIQNNHPHLNVELWTLDDPDLTHNLTDWDTKQRFAFAQRHLKATLLRPAYSTSHFLPYPLTIEQYSVLFSQHLEEGGSSSVVKGWCTNCTLHPHEKRETFLLQPFMKEKLSFNVSDLNAFYDAFERNLNTTLNHLHKTVFTDYTSLSINIDKAASHIQDFVLIINAIQHQQNTLSLSINVKEPAQTPRAFELLESLRNKKINSLYLNGNNLGKIGAKAVFVFIENMLKHQPQVTSLALGQNNLYTKEVSEIIQFIHTIGKRENPLSISLFDNGFWQYDLEDLLKIDRALAQYPNLHIEYLIGSNEDSQELNKKVTDWDEEKKLILARLLLKQHCTTLPFTLKKEHRFTVLQEHVTTHPEDANQLDIWVKYFDLSEEQRFLLVKKRMALSSEFCWIKDYQLNDEHRQQVYLESQLENADTIVSEDNYDLYQSHTRAHPLFQAWKQLSDILQECDEVEVDFTLLLETLKQEVLPKLQEACETLWPVQVPIKETLMPYLAQGQYGNANLVTIVLDYYGYPCINKLRLFNANDPNRSYASLVASQWLLWASVLLTTRPNLTLLQLEDPLNEILDFAEPKTRYALTYTLVQTVYANTTHLALYQQLTKARTWTRVLSIPLCQLLLAANITKLDIHNSTLDNLPPSYKEGRYQRPLVGALIALSSSSQLTAAEKMELFHNAIALNKNAIIEQFNLFIAAAQNKEMSERLNQLTQIQKTLLALCGDALHKLPIQKTIETARTKALTQKESHGLRRALFEGSEGKRVLQKRVQNPKEAHLELKKQRNLWILIEGLAPLFRLELLKSIPQDKLQDVARALFGKVFTLSEEALTHYEQAFAGKRNEVGLLTYFGKLSTLKKNKRQLITTFNTFVQSVLSKDQRDFFALRYNETKTAHLQKLFQGNPFLRTLWARGEKENLKDFIEKHNIQNKSREINLEKIIYEKIFLHKHLNATHYPVLQTYLETNIQTERKTIKEKLEAQETLAASNSTNKSIPSRELIKIRFQLKLICAIENTTEKRVNFLREANRLLTNLKRFARNENFEFQNDLSTLIKSLNSATSQTKKPLDISKYTLEDTDNHWDLFMCGTDVESCQRVDGDPSYNRCLLSYLLDGKNRLLVIKDDTGVIVARAIIRLLLDTKEDKVLLFLEEIYPSFMAPQFQLALELFAKQRAEKLCLTLVTAESFTASYAYPNPMESLGGVAPEYVDALQGIQEEGQFIIGKAQVLYQPELGMQTRMRSVLNELLQRQAEKEENQNKTEKTEKIVDTIVNYYHISREDHASLLGHSTHVSLLP